MKPILQVLANIFLFILGIWSTFIGLLWTGKLPKVSMYHSTTGNYSFKDSFNNKYIQSNTCPDPSKVTAEEFLDFIQRDEYIKSLKMVPIRDVKGEVYGQQSIENYLAELFYELKNRKSKFV